MKTELGIDTGDIILQQEVLIDKNDTTSKETKEFISKLSDGDSEYYKSLIQTIKAIEKFAETLSGDEKTGATIVLKAIEAPLKQIALNAGLDGSVILNEVLKSGKANYGFNALTNEYTDMVESGIIDPTKVTRSALENAASVAGVFLTTESVVADIKEPTPAPQMPAGGMGGMY